MMSLFNGLFKPAERDAIKCIAKHVDDKFWRQGNFNVGTASMMIGIFDLLTMPEGPEKEDLLNKLLPIVDQLREIVNKSVYERKNVDRK